MTSSTGEDSSVSMRNRVYGGQQRQQPANLHAVSSKTNLSSMNERTSLRFPLPQEVLLDALSRPRPYPMIVLPPSNDYWIEPNERDCFSMTTSSLPVPNNLVSVKPKFETDDTARCYRRYFLGKVCSNSIINWLTDYIILSLLLFIVFLGTFQLRCFGKRAGTGIAFLEIGENFITGTPASAFEIAFRYGTRPFPSILFARRIA
jgi:hypothetical protein